MLLTSDHLDSAFFYAPDLMLIRDGSDVVAVDTSSTNGTYLAGRSVAVLPLEDGHVLDLAGELEVAWHAA